MLSPELALALGAMSMLISVFAGASIKAEAFLNAKLSIRISSFKYTSTESAAASAELCITWTRVVVLGRATISPPEGRATKRPNSAPSLLAEGSTKPDATTTAAESSS